MPVNNLTKNDNELDDEETTLVNDSFANSTVDEGQGISITLAEMESVSPVTIDSELFHRQAQFQHEQSKDDKSVDRLSASPSAPDDESMEGYSLSSLPEHEKARVIEESVKRLEQEHEQQRQQQENSQMDQSDSESQFTFNQVGADNVTMHSASERPSQGEDDGDRDLDLGRILGIVSYMNNNSTTPRPPGRPFASDEQLHLSERGERRGPFALFRKAPSRRQAKEQGRQQQQQQSQTAFSTTSSLASCSSHSFQDQYLDDVPPHRIMTLPKRDFDEESHPSDEGGNADDNDDTDNDDGRDLSLFAAEIERARVAVQIPHVVDTVSLTASTPPTTPERENQQTQKQKEAATILKRQQQRRQQRRRQQQQQRREVKDMDQSLSQYLSDRRRTMQKHASHHNQSNKK